MYSLRLLDNVTLVNVDGLCLDMPPAELLVVTGDVGQSIFANPRNVHPSPARSAAAAADQTANKKFEHFGRVAESEYCWQREMQAYGTTAERRRRVSLNVKLRTSRKWNGNLVIAINRRDRSMPENVCRSCFSVCNIAYMYTTVTKTLCCNRFMCLRCIDYFAITQVERCVRSRVKGLMEMSRYPPLQFQADV